MRRLSLCALAAIVLMASGATCWDPIIRNRPKIAALRGFSSAEELRAFLADQAKTGTGNQGGGGGSPFWMFGLLPMGAPAPTALAEDGAEMAAAGDADNSGGARSEDPFSSTNIQEVGVDESDIVKNDGQTIYVLDGDLIHIAQAVPPEGVAELATLEIASSGESLYLARNKLVALSQSWSYSYYWDADDSGMELLGGEWNDGAETTVTVFDVSNPASPAEDATLEFEGSLATSRLIGNRLYLVLSSQPRLPSSPVPLELNAMTLDEWLPDFRVEGPDGTVRSGDIVDWSDFYRPEEPNGYTITTVVTLDIENPTAEFESTAITADTGVIYASTEALYITDTDYEYTSYAARENTAVHKLTFGETGTQYAASGFVPGRPLNQYSLGEYEDHLRIATTVSGRGWGTSGNVNAVYVLGEAADAKLEVVGKVENIAPGETIFSARFVGPRGFLVTFEKVDPLFTMDLTDPTKPAVVGELKVPGYSDHIQLMDEDHLLTIGKDADDMGDFSWYQGVQLSIFDVSDMANPTLLHKKVIGNRGTESEANYNPKAFNYFAAKDALAFPIEVRVGDTRGGPSYGEHVFSGLYVYHVTVADGFEFLGGIASMDEASYDGWWYYGSAFTRGVFIGDTVYSVTESDIQAASLDDVGTIIGQASFERASEPDDGMVYPEEDIVFAPAMDPSGRGVQ